MTGASAGIGRAFAERLARDGFDLVLVARRRDRLEAIAADLGARHGIAVEVVVADLTRAEELREVEHRVASDEALELLINNAGFATIGPLVSLSPDGEEDEIRLNVIATVRLTRAALPGMIARGRGAIVNLSSLAAFQVGVQYATYASTKAFLNTFTESVAEEVRGSGVRLQALCPGFTRTEFQERAGLESSRIPGIAWMEAEPVVDASLAALARGRVVCVPGIHNRISASFLRRLPRAAVRRLSRALSLHYLR